MTFEVRTQEETKKRGRAHGQWIVDNFGDRASIVPQSAEVSKKNVEHNARFIADRHGLRTETPLNHIILK